MQLKHITIAAAIAAAALSAGCNYEEDDDVLASRRSQDAIARQQEEQKDGKDYTIWQFVHETSALYYLWNNNVPISYLDYSLYESPEALFESFRATDDRFSTVLNNYTETEDMFKNISTTDGINYQLYLDEGTDLIAVVEYVYDDSPAKAAGIERGFVIHKVNGTQLTASNYADLLDQETCTYTYSNIEVKKENGEKIVSYGADMKESKPITKKRMDINPVLKSTVIVKNGRRIGYFLYDSFSDDTDVLIKTIEKLAAKQIDDLVLDLRLNGGGFINTLDTLASMIVPEGNERKLFLTETFNSLITSEFRRETQNRDFNKTYFAPNLPNLNLSRLYVLTSQHTASASEELISGLMPYMPVTIIGKKTYGKFTSNYLINDTEDEGSDDDGIPYNEWAVYLCVASCTNANGEMNFKNGFAPDYEVDDTYQYELGDENEPLLKTALDLCAGSLAKSAQKQPTPLQGYFGHYGKPIDRFGLISKKN